MGLVKAGYYIVLKKRRLSTLFPDYRKTLQMDTDSYAFHTIKYANERMTAASETMERLRMFSVLFMLTAFLYGFCANVNYKVQGLLPDRDATVSLGSASWLSTQSVEVDGEYSFSDVPAGLHSLKITAPGYNVPATKLVRVNEAGSVDPQVAIELVVTPMSDDPTHWVHEWQQDESVEGYTKTSYVNNRPEVEFLGKKIVPADVPYASILLENYNIILSEEDCCWTQEYAYRLVETLKTLVAPEKRTKFILTDEKLTDDIRLEQLEDGDILTVSRDAFTYANPYLVNLDGVRGRFFSKRLHHAMTKFVTNFGSDKGKVDHILTERFGVSINVPDYEALTAGITDEDAGRFQEFGPSELVAIINMYEELPEGFHKTPHLNYLIRRVNGHKHPLYPEAAGVAWPVENGYIEFMSSAFSGTNEQFDTQRLILHEKSHFLWAFTMGDEVKNDWIELGGWYRDPNAGDNPQMGWSTTKTTEFVSAYAHAHNPDEDMAESIAFYLKDPEKLQSRSMGKYEFIRDRIMHGTRYISSIPDYLTFEVLNLNPDYDYPGKIKRVAISVDGAQEEDKTITMEIELNDAEGYQDDASSAIVRISSPVFYDQHGQRQSQFVDLWMNPVDGNGHLLRGSVEVSKYSKNGFWTCGDIRVIDLAGNERFEGRNDCVTNVFICNPLEDTETPEYKSNSLEYQLCEGVDEGHHVQILKVSFEVSDNIGLSHTFCRVDNDYEGWSKGGTGLTDCYGIYNPETGKAEIEFIIPDFYPSANYFVTFIEANDLAGTEMFIPFSESPLDEPIKYIHIDTPTPDYDAPEIDLNRMVVYAEPTHPEAPDGETLVTVNFYGRDNISGFGPLDYWFRDPQGLIHGNYWFYHRNSSGRYFDGDPTVWEHYKITHILPQGSAPGIWGLQQICVNDKAGNERTYNFVETLIFEPDESTDDYVLFTELNDNILTVDFTDTSGSTFGYTWRIINEDTGEEINGATDDAVAKMSAAAKIKAVSSRRGTDIDLSALSDGRLIVIVNAFDADGNVVAVKSSHLEKGNTGVGNILSHDDNDIVDVVTISGVVVKRSVSFANWKEGLPAGFYIVGGKKEILK